MENGFSPGFRVTTDRITMLFFFTPIIVVVVLPLIANYQTTLHTYAISVGTWPHPSERHKVSGTQTNSFDYFIGL